MSDETFGDFSPWQEAPLILAALSASRRGHRFRAVFAPFSTVYRAARQPENAVVPGFWRIDPQKRRLKTAKTVETGSSAVAAEH